MSPTPAPMANSTPMICQYVLPACQAWRQFPVAPKIHKGTMQSRPATVATVMRKARNESEM